MHSKLSKGERISLDPEWRIFKGNGYGVRGPSLLGRIHWPVTVSLDTEAFRDFLIKCTGLSSQQVEGCVEKGGIQMLFELVCLLGEGDQNPVFHKGTLLGFGLNKNKNRVCLVLIPTFFPRYTLALLEWILDAINSSALVGAETHLERLKTSFDKGMAEVRSALKRSTGSSVNNYRILKAAFQVNLPFRLLPDGLLLVGTGRNGKLFNSTLTEEVSALSVRMARLKSVTSKILKMHGLPTTKHYIVETIEQAIDGANRLGYPVVIKPDDKDGGEGVYTDLRNELQLKKYFSKARSVSSRLLIEKHFAGNDYRITVMDGKVVKAIGRTPGGVVGDGIRSIENLIGESSGQENPLSKNRNKVKMDDEAISLLQDIGLTKESVLPAGDFLALRRRANMSTGGTSYNVIEKIHPDNERLAIGAAEALRLDIAGIDLLIPDIAISWLDSAAAICEVNAQPQISTEFAADVYYEYLSKSIKPPVRLKIVLLIKFDSLKDLDGYVQEMSYLLAARGEQVVSILSNGIWNSGNRIGCIDSDFFETARGVELNRDASTLITSMTIDQVLAHGSPWQSVDHACALGLDCRDEGQTRKLVGASRMLKPHLSNRMVVAKDRDIELNLSDDEEWRDFEMKNASAHGLLDAEWILKTESFR